MPLRRPTLLLGCLLAIALIPTAASAQRKYRLLMVIPGDKAADTDISRANQFKAWGFQPTFARQDQTREELLTAVANSDVCFISERCDATQIGEKLSDTPVGLLTDDYQLAEELGFSKLITPLALAGNAIVADPDHAVMSGMTLNQPLPDLIGDGRIYVSSADQLGAGVSVLSTYDGKPHFLAVEKAGRLTSGRCSPGRRVLLAHIHFDRANDDVLQMYRQALTWAANPRRFNYFVHPAGNDANDGRSRRRPFKTLIRAAKTASARDVVYVAPGVYQGPIRIVNGGAYRRTLRFIADRSHRTDKGEVIVEGNGPTLVDMDYRFDTRFSRIKFRKAKNLVTIRGGTRLRFDDCQFLDAEQMAIQSLGAGLLLYRCDITNCNDGAIVTEGGYITWLQGSIKEAKRGAIAAKDAGSRLIVRDAKLDGGQAGISWLNDAWGYADRCTVRNTKAAGAFLLASGNVRLRDCRFEDNLQAGIRSQLSDKAALSIERCIISRSGGDGVHSDRGKVRIVNCQIDHSGGDALWLRGGNETVTHNTLVDNTGDGVDSNSSRRLRFYNNIVSGNGGTGVRVSSGSVRHDYNLVHGNGVDYRGTSAGDNAVLLAPAFEDAGSDYRLSESSPAIDMGWKRYRNRYDLSHVRRPQGVSYDLGCYESPFKKRVKILEWVEVR